MTPEVTLEKGSIVSDDYWWYVVVEQSGAGFNCICDNANNVYYITTESIHSYMTLKEIGLVGWDRIPDRIPDGLRERGIPYEVIVEVLSGVHDDRFGHWKGEHR